MPRPAPLSNIYRWRHSFHAWLEDEAPASVASEVVHLVEAWSYAPNCVGWIFLNDFEKEYVGGLSPETIAWLKANVGPEFGVMI